MNADHYDGRKCGNCGTTARSHKRKGRCVQCYRTQKTASAKRTGLRLRIRGRKYGLSDEELQKLEDDQGGKCAICRSTDDRALAVDHDHETGRVRGLLCLHCNTALGKFKDDVQLLQKAIDYLNRT